MTVFEIPLQPTPQKLSISLAGVTYTLVVRWCWPAECWVLDLYDSTGLNSIITGIPLVTGTDLLSQYGYLNLGGQLVVQSDTDPDAVPTFDNLGTQGHLYFIPS